jgi:flagellar biosynthesis GTPase FlhF
MSRSCPFFNEHWRNCFSSLTSEGADDSLNLLREIVKLKKGENKLVLGQRLITKGGFVSSINMVPDLNQMANNIVESKSMIKNISVEIKKLHKILGNRGENYLKATANAYEVKLLGKIEACESCALSKAKQKKTNKIWNGSSNIPGERL